MREKPFMYVSARQHQRVPTSARRPSRSIRRRHRLLKPFWPARGHNLQPLPVWTTSAPVLELIHGGRLQDGGEYRLITAIDAASRLLIHARVEPLDTDSPTASIATPTTSAAT